VTSAQASRSRHPLELVASVLSSRLVFQIVVGVFMAATLLFLVIRPAVDRGGAVELLVIAGIFAAVLLTERWLRRR